MIHIDNIANPSMPIVVFLWGPARCQNKTFLVDAKAIHSHLLGCYRGESIIIIRLLEAKLVISFTVLNHKRRQFDHASVIAL